MQLLDGKQLSLTLQDEIALQVQTLKVAGKKTPHLAAVLVGNNAASETYVSSKIKACQKIGFKSTLLQFDHTITQQELLKAVQELNDDEDIDGILVQLPLPAQVDEEKITEAISPDKDVDGFHPVNIGRMVKGLKAHLPATPYGILLLLERYKIETSGKHCVVIGRSNIVGTPISLLLSRNAYPGNCTVTITHSKTKNLKEICLQADILVAAIGKPDFVKADWIKDGAVVIDVGINRVEDPSKKSGFRLKGDVDFDNVAPKCNYITPVPGGVGPLTIAALMMNTLNAVNAKYK
ncbi:MAG TPA: bifunctional methylenetetrahydrofolate dehydrogenase/methenyltetrahydrofolate cyclohydrolase FolD [Chitinophagales bacterium]|nr:bifunctional methylenetetrahydrofolate dehydrogenase/methenyltetrahydrofolate cyclohydrolase FolD [Chitinophagales bacterium]